MSSTAIERILCGHISPAPTDFDDEKVIVLRGLARLINSYYSFSIDFKQNLATPQSSYFMPVSLRSLMETATIALLARVDPLRVIHSSLCQDSANYDRSRPQPAALKWKGDVVADSSDSGTGSTVWNASLSGAKIPRNLLSEQLKEAFWKPAIGNLTNWHIAKSGTSTWITELATQTPDEAFRKINGSGKRIYSELSKGIHPEFAVRRESEFDEVTLQRYLEDVMKWVGTLGVISHFAGGLYSGISADIAYNSLLEIEGTVNE